MVAALLKLLKFCYNILSSLSVFASISEQLTVFLPTIYKSFISLISVNVINRDSSRALSLSISLVVSLGGGIVFCTSDFLAIEKMSWPLSVEQRRDRC